MENLMTANEVLLNNGLHFEVRAKRVFDENQNEIKGFRAIQRIDTGDTFKIMTDGYRVIQNWESLNILDEVVDSGFAKYSGASSFKGGAIVMVRAEVPKLGYGVEGDDIKTYIHVATSHDGSMSNTIFTSSQRLICQNLLTVGMRRDVDTLKVRHTKNYKIKMDEFKVIYQKYADAFRAQKRRFEEMARRDMSKLQLDAFLDKLFGESSEKDAKRTASIKGNKKETVKRLYYDGIGHSCLRNSNWKAFQAVTQYISHEKSSRRGMREYSNYFSSGAKLRERALVLLAN